MSVIDPSYITRFLVPSVSAYSQHESELVPTIFIVRFVDAHATHEQVNEKCDWSNDPVPEAAPKSGRFAPGFLYLEFDPAMEMEFAIVGKIIKEDGRARW